MIRGPGGTGRPNANAAWEGRAPRVSVVMPVYQGAATVERAVASIRAQEMGDWELIAVDDGSSDGTGALLDRLAVEDPRIRVCHEPHRGIVGALERGLAAARGEFVARMDADDVSLPGRLSAQVAYLEDHPDVGVVGTRVRYGGDSRTSAGYAAHVDWLNGLMTGDAMERARFIEAPLAHPSVMFRRELPSRFGGYRDGAFPEDYELWLRWMDAGVRMGKVAEELLVWHDLPGRLSRADPRYAPEAFYALKARYLARWMTQAGKVGGPVWVWGAGRVTRRRVEWLMAEGVRVTRYVDVDPRKQGVQRGGRVVVGPEALPGPGEVFLVGYVANRGAREQQRSVLTARGWVEGEDYLFAA